jgi:chromosome segregation ATPase
VSSTAQQRLGEARASLATAELAVAAERATALDQQLSDALAEGRNIDEQIKAQGQRLASARQHAEGLWTRRALVNKALLDLGEALPEFPLAAELETYEGKRATLEAEFQSLSAQISDASITVAQGQDAIDKLAWAKHRAQIGIGDLRLAVRQARAGKRL